MYISANLPARYGVFEDIRKDNYPFNQVFSQYIELIARIGIHHRLDIVEAIGFIEDGIMGNERLPDIPVGNEAVRFRFKTESEITQQFYQSQEMSNRQITLLIIMMTLRLSQQYGTSLYRIYSRISDISGLSEKKKPTPKVIDKKQSVQKQKVTIKKRNRVTPKDEPSVDEQIEEPSVDEQIEEPSVDEPEESVQDETPDVEEMMSRMAELTQRGSKLLEAKGKVNKEQEVPDKDESDDDTSEGDNVVVKPNPALGDFFPSN